MVFPTTRLILAFAIPAVPPASPAPSTSRTPVMTSPAANRDFDFLLGTWRRHDRRLRRGPSGSAEWQEFEGTSVVRPIWDGLGNIEEYQADAPDGRCTLSACISTIRARSSGA